MRLLKAMQESERFSQTEQGIVSYILAHPQEIAELTTRELAERTYTSPAGVFRLCQKLGLKGYNEFKLKFISEVNRVTPGEAMVRRPITGSDRPVDILRKMAALEIEAIEETKNELASGQIARIARRMRQAKTIDFYAYDQNYLLAEMAVYNLLQVRRPAACYGAMNSQFAQAMCSDASHYAVIISRTGENRRLIRTARLLKDRAVPTLLLSTAREATLTHLATDFIYIANTVEYLDMGGMVFSVGARYVLDTLFGLLLASDYENIETFYGELEQSMGHAQDEKRVW